MVKTALLVLLGLLTPAWALEVNHASEAELDGLRGLGPAFTRRLLRERDIHPFTDWPDLMHRVSGMGQLTAQKLSAQGLKWTPDLRQQFKWDTVTRNGVNHDRDKKAQRTPAGAQSQGRA